MRFISGKYKGRRIEGFDIVGTRPTMDRVKESLFAMINSYLKESLVLDLFAGTGSLGLEAISNGSKEAYFVDKNIISTKTIKKTVENTKIEEKINILNIDYKKALEKFKNENLKFDIIFLDPPYNDNLINDCLKKIKEYDLLKNGGIIVCEYEKENLIDIYPIYKEKKYGSKYIKIYKSSNS